MKTAKIFQNGQSQAVRLPKEFRFDDSEVFIKKIGYTMQLTPRTDSQNSLIGSLKKFSGDVMAERTQPELEKREVPMKLMLDINTCIYILKQKPEAVPAD